MAVIGRTTTGCTDVILGDVTVSGATLATLARSLPDGFGRANEAGLLAAALETHLGFTFAAGGLAVQVETVARAAAVGIEAVTADVVHQAGPLRRRRRLVVVRAWLRPGWGRLAASDWYAALVGSAPRCVPLDLTPGPGVPDGLHRVVLAVRRRDWMLATRQAFAVRLGDAVVLGASPAAAHRAARRRRRVEALAVLGS